MHIKECQLSLLYIKVHSFYILQKPGKTISPADGDTDADADADADAEYDDDIDGDGNKYICSV